MTETLAAEARAETGVPSAVVIPFRPRAATVPAQAAAPMPAGHALAGTTPTGPARPSTPEQQRLARALETLNGAIATQRAAMAQWRAALGELKTTTAGLGESLTRYQSSLASLSAGVSSLRTQASTLKTWADKATGHPG